MSKKLFILGGILVLALALVFSQAFAKGETAKTTTAKPTATKTQAANVFAVCGCGKVFTPNANTEYVKVGDKSYACCSHECHEQAVAMVVKDPVGTAKMMNEKTAQALEKLSPKTATTTTEAAPK